MTHHLHSNAVMPRLRRATRPVAGVRSRREVLEEVSVQ